MSESLFTFKTSSLDIEDLISQYIKVVSVFYCSDKDLTKDTEFMSKVRDISNYIEEAIKNV